MKKKTAARSKLKIPQKQASGIGDMYSNPQANVGFGTTSQVNSGLYVPYRISLDYLQLLNMYRGSWKVRAIIDTIPEDMLKGFPQLVMETDPEDISRFNQIVAKTHTLQKMIEGCKWGRLFGGAIAIIILKGQNDLSKPLVLDEVQPDSYRGLIVVDRWSGCSPSSELISDTDNPAEYGQPAFYEVTTEVSQTFRVHHSRVLRFTGRDLPLFERQIQTYWGMSECEAIYQELQRSDFIDAGIADLVSRAHVLVMKEPMLAQMLSGVNLTQQQYVDYVNRMRAVSETISTNGILAIGADGGENSEVYNLTHTFAGLRDIHDASMENLSGASGIPMSRWGRSITGLGNSGEGELQVYYDSLDQKRNHELRPAFDKLIPIICMSTLGEVPEDLEYNFAPMRTMSSKERAELAKNYTEPILATVNAGVISPQIAAKELASTSTETGLFSNVTEKFIATLDDEVQPGEMPEAETERESLTTGPESGVKDFLRRVLKRAA